VTDAVLLATDETGEVRYRIAAREAEELPDESRLVMSQVLIDYQPAAHVPWRISATTAEGPVDRSYLELRGDVTIRSEPSDGAQPVLVRTTLLHLDRNTSVVAAGAGVQVQIGTQRLRGTGLGADLMGDRLELESHVHGQILR